jgi:hypothetical protein
MPYSDFSQIYKTHTKRIREITTFNKLNITQRRQLCVIKQLQETLHDNNLAVTKAHKGNL